MTDPESEDQNHEREIYSSYNIETDAKHLMTSNKQQSDNFTDEDDFEHLLPQNDSFEDMGAVPSTKIVTTEAPSCIKEPCKMSRNKNINN